MIIQIHDVQTCFDTTQIAKGCISIMFYPVQLYCHTHMFQSSP